MDDQHDDGRKPPEDGVTPGNGPDEGRIDDDPTGMNAVPKRGGILPELDKPQLVKVRRPNGGEVGYARPPKEHRFQPGTSGNPRGRPIGAKTRRFGDSGHRLFDGLRAELERLVRYRENGEDRDMPALQAIIRAHVIKAMQGQIGSARLILDAASQIDSYERRQHERHLEALLEYKQSWEDNLCALERDPSPEKAAKIPLPHPDHIEVDFSTGELLVKGPMNEAERDALEQAYALREQYLGYLETVEEWLATEKSKRKRVQFEDMRARLLEKIREISDALGEDE